MAAASLLPPIARRLEGKVALITGAASGIGECTARLFTKHGAKVVIADIQDKQGEAVCKDIGGATIATAVHCDVSKEEDVRKAVDIAVEKYGKLDVMICSAYIPGDIKPSILDINVVDFDQVMKVNLTGAFLCAKHAARVMIPALQGSIINLGSVSSTLGGISPHAYTSSKHALVGLTKNVAVELGQYGIRVNCVSPYFIPTPLTMSAFKLKEEDTSAVFSNIHNRHLQAQDVAESLLYLASDESKYVSGHNLAVDGGFTITNPAFGVFSRKYQPLGSCID